MRMLLEERQLDYGMLNVVNYLPSFYIFFNYCELDSADYVVLKLVVKFLSYSL